MKNSGLIKISEMAALHGVSRQTLILYDKNGLLKPAMIAENGYRYYSIEQIPRLRQICLLKEMGVPLTDIRTHLEQPTAESMRALLAQRRAAIAADRDRLNRQLEEIDQLDEIFAGVTTKEKNVDMPHVVWIEERKALFSPYPAGPMDPKLLHMALMGAWGRLLEAGSIPSRGFGSLLDCSALATDEPLEGAGSIVILPRDMPLEGARVVTLPAGEYVCMYKHAMPYDVSPARRLLAWMGERGFEPAGPLVDRCLLDSVFYQDGRSADFCRIEILLREAGGQD